MLTRAHLLVLVAITVACEGPETSRDPKRDSVVVAAPPAADTGITQVRADWATFVHTLPKEPQAAAMALERYRRDNGLPFDFFLRPDAPQAATASLEKQEDDMGCGTLVTAFVRRVPRDHRVLMILPAIEFDSGGRILQRWPLPGEAGFYEVVAGVVGEDLIVAHPEMSRGVFMRIKPDGSYAISAQPPPPLEREEWIEVGDSGWYVRTDSVPGQRSLARAITRAREPAPRMVTCPASAEFEGMVCRGFPEGEREHRIAYPMPCT